MDFDYNNSVFVCLCVCVCVCLCMRASAASVDISFVLKCTIHQPEEGEPKKTMKSSPQAKEGKQMLISSLPRKYINTMIYALSE